MHFNIRKYNIRLIVLVLFYILYLVIGASIFSAIEGPIERDMVKRIRHYRRDFLHKGKDGIKDGELEAFIVEIVKASERGVSAIRNVSSEPNWSFGQSLFFAGTILTTIGYGHTTPLSEGGKLFCIIYALIGIPLTLIMFTAVVERLMVPSTLLLEYLMKRLEHLYKPVYIRLLHLVVIFVILLSLVFLIPAAIFTYLEERWNYLDSFYYTFISMTTIGLGDYIPGDQPEQKNRAVYKIITTIYLLLGLIMMMFTLAVIYEIPELNLGLHFYMKSDEVTDEEKLRLRNADTPGPKYTQQVDEPDDKTGDAEP